MNAPIKTALHLLEPIPTDRQQRICFLALALGLGLGIIITSGQPKQPAAQPSLQDNNQVASTLITRIEAQVPRTYAN